MFPDFALPLVRTGAPIRMGMSGKGRRLIRVESSPSGAAPVVHRASPGPIPANVATAAPALEIGTQEPIRDGVATVAQEPEIIPSKLHGKWIVWSVDGLRIVGSGETSEEAEEGASEPFEFHQKVPVIRRKG